MKYGIVYIVSSTFSLGFSNPISSSIMFLIDLFDHF